MTRKQASKFVRSAGSEICIRYIADPTTKGPMFAEQFFQITRRAPRVAAGVMSASLTLSTAAYSQGGARPADQTVNARDLALAERSEAEESTPEETPSLHGTLRGAKGDPVGSIEVLLTNIETKEREHEYSDDDGKYEFTDVAAGTYELRIDSSTGFRKKIIREIKISDGQTLTHDLYLTPVIPPVEADAEGEGTGSGFGYGVGGAVAFIEYAQPLTRAVADNEIDEVRRLLASGADPNGKEPNYEDVTPLFMAVENGNVEVTRLLLRFRADPNARDKTERTPIMTIDGDATPELIELLTRAGADVNADDDTGRTPLMLAASNAPSNVVSALIDAGADINETDDDGSTALIDAADADDLESVRVLVFAGATVNAKDKNGESAWDKTSDREVEEFLVSYGAEGSVN
ncbi:MAG TPA: ankyrin repeat domain-containing protein [Pyrinomonadaceae bacterium]|nr:ankyrin repeat domain-containing protein [Pyrinomonadaceae bacterium]